MIVYDYDLIVQSSIEIAVGISTFGYDNLFFKCVHFFEETGVFGYFNNDENRKFIFQFKKFSNNQIIDHFQTISELPINDISFNINNVKTSDMIKIEDKKFYYVGLSVNGEILYIISIYNYYSENLVSRIYSININNLYSYKISFVLKINLNSFHLYLDN